jgi:hypothetical protein
MSTPSPSPPTTTTIHGLAAKIRAATSSESFDFGGLSASTIPQVIHDAFSTDFPPPPPSVGSSTTHTNTTTSGWMIRITLIVGGGKSSRQKYLDQAPKLVTTTLSQIGYQEDQGASCIAQCAGLYKVQHDTGKNLKTVVVFPKFAAAAADGSSTTTTTRLPHTVAATGGGGGGRTNHIPPSTVRLDGISIGSHFVHGHF